MYLIVRLAIHVMNRAPEETINRKSPSKHACTGMVGAVPSTGGTGTQRGPARCLYGLHTGKGAGRVPYPHRVPYSACTVARMGAVPFFPYRSRTVLPVWAPYHFARTAPYRFARTGPEPFCPHVALTTLCAIMEPASRAGGV